MPRISVVTPCYQHAAFLQATIESVLSQGYPNLEYIVIDGGSTDGSVDILRRYSDRLAYWCSEKDEGHYDAVNKGLARATGEILCWLNSDDLFFPWTLRTVASIFSQLADVEWLTTLQPGFWDAAGFCLGFETVAGYSREAFMQGCYLPAGEGKPFLGYVQQESTFWRRGLWQRAGTQLRTQFSLAADFDLWGRFYQHAELYGVGSPLGGFRMAAGQRSADAGEYQRQALASLAACGGLQGNATRFAGKRIVRRGRDRADGFWAVEAHLFS